MTSTSEVVRIGSFGQELLVKSQVVRRVKSGRKEYNS